MADRRVRLYYFPSSFYSQMVAVTLREKEVKYEPVIINLRAAEHLEAWYMRMNPSGAVPTLQDGDKIIKESATIIDYVDKEFPSDSKLVPDLSTEMGREVSKWRRVLAQVEPGVITYGIACHPDLSVSGFKIPASQQKSQTELLADNSIMSKKMEQLAGEHPDLREAYMAKAGVFVKRSEEWRRENVVKALDELETVLDQVEQQLKKVEADPSKELWFCGQQFTAADIILCVLLGHLQLTGLSERYHGAEKRPRLHAYWEQARKRPSINRHCLKWARDFMKQKLIKGAKVALPVMGGLLALGLAAGLAFIFAQRK